MNKENKEPASNNYIFPDFLGKFMGKLDQRTQYEGGMMGSFLILIGLVLMTIYFWLYGELGLAFKIIATFNAIAGFLVISSNLVTLFQQYQAFMSFQQTQLLMKDNTTVNIGNLTSADMEEMRKQFTDDEWNKIENAERQKVLKPLEPMVLNEENKIKDISVNKGERRIKKKNGEKQSG